MPCTKALLLLGLLALSGARADDESPDFSKLDQEQLRSAGARVRASMDWVEGVQQVLPPSLRHSHSHHPRPAAQLFASIPYSRFRVSIVQGARLGGPHRAPPVPVTPARTLAAAASAPLPSLF